MDIERAVLDELRPAFDEEYLRQLAEAALPDPDTFDYEGEVGNIRAKIERRHAEKVRLARKLANDNTLDFLADAVAGVNAEIEDLETQVDRLQQRMQLQVDRVTIEEQVEHIARQMGDKLDDLDDTEYAQLADILQLEVERVGCQTFVGTASILIPFDGENCESGPQGHGPHHHRNELN